MEFNNLLKLYYSQDVLGEVQDSIFKNIEKFGCTKDDLEVCYE